jgi:PAS domain S-box-containing protein
VRVSGKATKPPRRQNWPSRGHGHNQETPAVSGRSRQQRAPSAGDRTAEPFRSFDWASTELGPASRWPQSVRTAVAICGSIASAQQEALIASGRSQRRRKAELIRQNNALRSQVARYNATLEAVRVQLEILNSVPSMVWTNTPDGRCEFVNRFYLETTGLSADYCMAPPETWKKSPLDLPPHLSGVHPDHRERAARIFWDGVESGRGWAYEVPIRHADGSYHWHLRRAVPLHDSKGNLVRFVGTSVDIQDLKVAQERLKTAEERARLIIDHALDAIIVIDSDSIISGWNERAEEIFGWSRAQVVGKRLTDFIIPREYRKAHKAGLKRFLTTGEGPALNKRIEITGQHRDGRKLQIELSIAAMKLENRWTFSAFIRDLTESRRIAEALRETREELAWMSRLTAMEQISASIAHEIKQPLSAIVTNTETCLYWLSSPKPDLEKARVTTQRIGRDANRAIDVIGRIRSLMKKTVSERTPLDINALISEVLELTEWELRKQRVSVQTELSPLLPMIPGDRIQLQQVVLNLVLNGMEAMTSVEDRPRLLSVKSQPYKDRDIQVSFQDSGIGIDSASADRVFEAFFTTKPNGTGMGLPICRAIVEAHGGHILAKPGVPHGAVFQFSLPNGGDVP